MNTDQTPRIKLPPSLYAVIGLFVILGFLGVYDVLVALLRGGLKIDLYVLLLPCAYGLSQVSNGWRKVSIVTALIFLLVNTVGIGMLFLYSESLNLLAYFQLALGIALPLLVYGILISDKVRAIYSNEH